METQMEASEDVGDDQSHIRYRLELATDNCHPR